MPSSRARRELKASEPRPPGLFLPHFGPPERARRHGTRQLEQRGSIRVGNDDESSLVDEGIGAKRADGRVEIQESDCYEKLGFGFSTMKKWTILCVIFVVQISMNFNTSVYANAITPMSKEFSLPEKTIRLGQMIFLVAYAFGCELWAPWSEELGRWPIMQLSLLLVNIWQVLCALAPSFRVIFAGRLLGGLSSAGGSVTLGMIADMWEADDQQFAVAFIVLSSVAGSVVGPIAGGFMEVRLHWRWNFWIQLVAGIAVQLCHFLLVPETRATILLDREAKRMRRFGVADVYGPGEIHGRGCTFKELREIWIRPFSMFVREPIVLCLSLLSGFSDALIFTFLESYQPVFSQWGFGTIQVGLAFIPIIIGYVIGYLSFIPVILHHKKDLDQKPYRARPERRLWWLQITAPLECLGLFLFAWSSFGPPYFHWISPMFFSMMIAIANYCIYMATIDYMIASYGPYSASATGGNAFARDLLAGIAALYSTPFYKNGHPSYELVYPSLILSGIAFLVTIPIYVFYKYGPQIRKWSKFAQTVATDRDEIHKRRARRANRSTSEKTGMEV
ncbi:hypothetical protein D8B26_000620 [Coccidioides posadasii str. Silveira]|uniref:Multidrug transporter n=2 Tax=Coccidioides posadasii TaxID=199306 RepID=A0A0J6HXN6_COCPO|nr:Major Facilitator Superfamily protein [Coccidioides posadasii C735 delta SOWgp]EER28893.1 Major Facilitator Superfamily protein [Coccidioides posadasii C735 delta SOWgp]KMM63712.1 multidrug transporter [Coccidioides posadasii RMSCC 3488]QVM05913.1 hypothetical protein D8B26_000620 [Coccidioides posadasii str. Silveira]|eukprot:XP_003071038.1 Major Facilitator Superfamily protein [Coccidioides posadasii C735 delta SOWgp]